MKTHMIKSKLKAVLEDRGKSMYWLAQETGIAYSTLIRMTKDRAQSIDLGVLDTICNTLSCQPGDLLIHTPRGQNITRSTAK
jgi:putative transcriptional regulator